MQINCGKKYLCHEITNIYCTKGRVLVDWVVSEEVVSIAEGCNPLSCPLMMISLFLLCYILCSALFFLIQ